MPSRRAKSASAAHVVVARLRPRVDRSVPQCAIRIANDEGLVVLENCAETIAALACAARIVEREKLRRWSGRARAVVWTLESLCKAQLLESVGENDHAFPVAVSECSSDCVGKACAHIIRER